jgi:16S rRNA (adenine1518-N6/adenine1519-N6)-dimethyltransferase
MEYSLTKFKQNMEKHKFNFKKMYGQNFIIDENIINNIIDKSYIDKETLVIEVGPGAGSLTYKLASAASYVISYEIDPTLKDLLFENLKGIENVKIIFEDFLKSDIKKEIEKYNCKKIYLVANLPYYITTPIIQKIIDENIPVDKMVVMVQKEVGDRFTSKCGTKDYSSITVFLNYFFDIRKEFIVSKNAFYPKPNVDSMIISLNKKINKIKSNNEELFFKLVRDSFQFKRKTLKNNLRNYDWEKIENYLTKKGYLPTVRAEQLELTDYVELSNIL